MEPTEIRTNHHAQVEHMTNLAAEIASLGDWLNIEMECLTDAVDELDWSIVDNARFAKQRLVQALERLSGTSAREIQRNLDELHM
jgi:hypothetical protein